MHFTSLYVERFRGLRDARVEGLARVNLLLGKNNSGKTSLLEAFYIASGVGAMHRLSLIDMMRAIPSGEEAGFRTLFYGMKPEAGFCLSAVFDSLPDSSQTKTEYDVVGSGANLKICVRPTREEEDVVLLEESDTAGFESSHVSESVETTVTSSLLPRDIHVKISRDRLRGRSIAENDNLLRDFKQSGFVQTHLSNTDLVKRFSALQRFSKTAHIMEVVRIIDPHIKAIEVIGDKMYVDVGFAEKLPLGLLGDGVRRLVAILTAAAVAEGSVVCIDEIDNGLHRDALAVLWQGVLHSAETFGVQVFATTHNRETLTALTDLLDQEEHQRYRDHVAAFNVVRQSDDSVRAYRYDADQLDFALDKGLDVRS